MTDKERFEELAYNVGISLDGEKALMSSDDYDFLYNYALQQTERAEELEKERSEWKGKYSILKNKYRALQRKMKNKWRYNRALENESRTNEIVLEEFREENKRYREALEEIRGLYPLRNVGYQISEIRKIVIKALEGEE